MTNIDNFECISFWKCKECGKLWEEIPKRCSCKKKFSEGAIIGAFQLKEDKNGKDKLKVRCLICNCTTEIYYSNLEKQKSCGCKPRHIEIIDINNSSIRYRCRKCDKLLHVIVPILEFCCEEGEE